MNNTKTNFGKRKVNPKLKTKLVQEVFTDVAKKYDLMNDLMSFGAHRLWKKEFIDLMNIQSKDKIIDVGSGTGDLINLILKKNLSNYIYSIDLNDQMLNFGKLRFESKKIKFINANAEKLPFKDNSFDKYIISFCLRNVTNINLALQEAYRTIKPGGMFFCLEFSHPKSQIINLIYKKYKKIVIPFLGKKITNNKKAYEYLEESIDLFLNQKELSNSLKKVGFEKINHINLFNGIVAIHKCYKI